MAKSLNYDGAVRAIREEAVDRVAKPLYDAIGAKLRELGVQADKRRAAHKTPKDATKHVNLRALLAWVDSVTDHDDDAEARKQLVVLHATARERVL